MADGSKIGGIHVDISANVAPLQAGLKQAETAAQQTAATIGESAARAGTKIETEVNEKVAKSERLVLGLQKAFKALILPVSIFTGMAALTARIVDAQKELFTLQESLAKVSEEFAKIGRTAAEDALSPLEKELRKIDAAAASAKEELDSILQGEQSKRGTLPGAIWARMWKGSIKEIEDRHDEAMDRIYGQQQNNRLRAIAKDRDRIEKAFWESANKQIDEFYEKRAAEEDKLRAKMAEDFQKDLEAQAKANKAADDERAANLIKNAKAVQSAFDAVLKSQRGAMDSNKLAIDIGRLAAAVEDMARSPRGPGMVVGGGW